MYAMHTCVHACVSTPVCKPEVNTGHFPLLFTRYYLETGSHIEPRAYLFSYTSCPAHAGDPPSMLFLHSRTEVIDASPQARLFLGCWGSELRYSRLGCKTTLVPHTHSRILDVNKNITHMVQ